MIERVLVATASFEGPEDEGHLEKDGRPGAGRGGRPAFRTAAAAASEARARQRRMNWAGRAVPRTSRNDGRLDAQEERGRTAPAGLRPDRRLQEERR